MEMTSWKMHERPPEPSRDFALFLDFDGTLVDIAASPDRIVVPPDLPGILVDLRHRLADAVAIVSGRPSRDLQRFLQPADAGIEKALLDAVTHRISLTRGLCCDCKSSGSMRAMPPEADMPTDEARRRALENSRARIDLRRGLDNAENPRAMAACRFFYIKLNDEAGVYHAICRRCQRKVTVYDRDLYWGTPRKTAAPETFPYNCSCGGHAFEVAALFRLL